MPHELVPAAAPLFISSLSPRFTAAIGIRPYAQNGTPSSAAWPAANRALYIPMALRSPYRIRRVWWVNGATANGNVDLGIYAWTATGGDLLYSTGAVAQAGTDAPQYVTKDLLLTPGEYYLALSLSSGTGTTHRLSSVSGNTMRILGPLQQATAHPLPSSMTPAAIATGYWPLFGITQTTTGY